MKAKQDLLGVYDAWRAWSEREMGAILDGDWLAVAECQDAKRQCQPQIIRLTEAAQQEWLGLGLDWAEVQRDVRAIVGVLMGLETRNSELLADQRRTAEAALAGLDGARRNLQRVQRSYAFERPAAWHSYS